VHGTNFVLPEAARAARVLTIHDLAFLNAPEELASGDRDLPALVEKGARRADVICTPTAAVADAVAERFDVDRDKIKVTPLGVDAGWFTGRFPSVLARKRLGLPPQYILFAGAAGPRKGLDWLNKAHALDEDLPPIVFTGPGAFPQTARSLRTGYLSDL